MTCVAVAILKKRLGLHASLYEVLQILSVTVIEQTPLSQLYTLSETASTASNSSIRFD